MTAPSSAGALRRSPLHDRHVALGAKLAGFGGWEMPVEYPAGTVAEHTAVRTAAGLFDVSHLGKVELTGPGSAAYVDATLTNALGRIGPGQAQYTLCCDDGTGGVVDDLIVYLHAEDRVLLVPNAANTAEVARRLAETAPAGVEVADRHEDLAVLAVQGPRADDVVSAVGLPVGHGYMSFVEAGLDGEPDLGSPAPAGSGPVVVCRTGYTGERGYELLVPWQASPEVWDRLLEAGRRFGLVPCGLGARDTLRTEMGYPLHGQDIGPEVSPVQARLGWAVGWDKTAFWGRGVLLAERARGPARTLRGLVAVGRGIPRPGMRVLLTPDLPVGEVTSGTFSPTLRKGVGLALVASQVTDGAEVVVDVRGRPEVFTLTRPPFVPSHVREPT
jgi:aminomethyltransferase